LKWANVLILEERLYYKYESLKRSSMWDFLWYSFLVYMAYVVIKIIRNPFYGVIFALKILRIIRGILTFIVSVIYFIMPVDILPDFILPYGWIDDIGFVFVAYRVFSFLSFVETVEDKKEQLQNYSSKHN
jgi:uncharacterized membrane protein YkvA (DUF1232 family)